MVVTEIFNEVKVAEHTRDPCCRHQGILKGKYHCTIDILFDWFGISCMTTDNFCFLFAKQTNPNQTGGQQYRDTSPFSIPCCHLTTETCTLIISSHSA